MDAEALYARYAPERTPEEQAAWDRDYIAGALQERARIAAILNLPEAEGRRSQALALALDDNELLPAIAARLLATCPLIVKADGQGSALDMSFAGGIGGSGGYAAGQEIGRRYGQFAGTRDPGALQ